MPSIRYKQNCTKQHSNVRQNVDDNKNHFIVEMRITKNQEKMP